MSDSGLSLGATPREVPRVRRLSNASTQPPSPVEPPDLDMSHLSETEKQQIEAVIARARQLQAEEQRRVRYIITTRILISRTIVNQLVRGCERNRL
ncbi:hypothetical protein LSH36_18g07004 [Paralvinella palmiformis]|uniref:RabBD domain-containing protein n=1 Tax=Paralvinella palmiformis TaxID=53620 RepID=A0AAD9NIE9_9ANNE|nr:hypothetical protein LSH36_18g07004 [Paralvinella palmiformis]